MITLRSLMVTAPTRCGNVNLKERHSKAVKSVSPQLREVDFCFPAMRFALVLAHISPRAQFLQMDENIAVGRADGSSQLCERRLRHSAEIRQD